MPHAALNSYRHALAARRAGARNAPGFRAAATGNHGRRAHPKAAGIPPSHPTRHQR
ncbi:hypothetical protein PUN4_860025 [Paraburkholderia unamae]|nr:hypothetical protein PUN4_860025 [Paraburkholderia unamae]